MRTLDTCSYRSNTERSVRNINTATVTPTFWIRQVWGPVSRVQSPICSDYGARGMSLLETSSSRVISSAMNYTIAPSCNIDVWVPTLHLMAAKVLTDY